MAGSGGRGRARARPRRVRQQRRESFGRRFEQQRELLLLEAGRHHQRRRRDLPRTGLYRVGGALQGLDGHDRELPSCRLGRRHRSVHGRHRRLRRHRRGDEARGGGGGQEEGRPRPHPHGARRGHGLLPRQRHRQGPQARRRHDRQHLPGQDQEVERPRDRQGQREHQPARQGHHRLPPLRRVGHDEELHPVPRRLLARVGERPWRRQDGQVARRHRRQGQRRRGRLRQADRRRGGLRRAGLRAAEQLHDRGREEQGGQLRRAVARRHLGGRTGRAGPRRPQVLDHQRAGPEDLPDQRRHLPARLAGPVQVRDQAGDREAHQELAGLRARRRPGGRPRSAVRAAARSHQAEGAGQGRRPAVQRIGDRRARPWKPGASQRRPAAAAHHSSGRRAPARSIPCCGGC